EGVSVNQGPTKRRYTRKIRERLGRTRSFDRRGNCYRRRRESLANTASFIRNEEKCPVLLDRSAKSSAELVLIELGLRASVRREAIRVGVQDFVSEKFVNISVKLVGA